MKGELIVSSPHCVATVTILHGDGFEVRCEREAEGLVFYKSGDDNLNDQKDYSSKQQDYFLSVFQIVNICVERFSRSATKGQSYFVILRMKFFLATFLCFMTWMSSAHATHGPVTNCLCPRISTTRPRIHLIKNYTIQPEGICHTAVVFLMQTGKSICSDPEKDWVKKAMLKVDQETKALLEMEETEQGSTTDITPSTTAPTMASTTAPNTASNTAPNTVSCAAPNMASSTASSTVSNTAPNTAPNTASSTVSTTSKKAPRKRRRTTRKRMRKATWRRMKGQRKRG
ncbi:fractalkine-like isoform X1 [Seriola aureovittata]|uniref:fractalkine-like isoform X1 n=2 Tax=Seriola aureovittata TaxID=2871759 RepID=UPI0024BE18D3|nr:fractalkine-like isoform X1 [Seriola aureovittata]